MISGAQKTVEKGDMSNMMSKMHIANLLRYSLRVSNRGAFKFILPELSFVINFLFFYLTGLLIHLISSYS